MASIIFNNVSFFYETPYQEVFSDLSTLIDMNWRCGLIGRNGQGKSTFLGLVNGVLAPSSGSLEVQRPSCMYPAIVNDNLTCMEVMLDAVAPYRLWEAEMELLLAQDSQEALDRYSYIQDLYQLSGGYGIRAGIEQESQNLTLKPHLLNRTFSTLSGGERTRALIAALFAMDSNYPLIDEPTNHLDLRGRAQISEYLAHQSGYLLVSHDRTLLDQSIDHVISINRSDITVSKGNYSSWKAHFDEVEKHELRTRRNIEKDVKQLRNAAAQRRAGASAREADKYHGSGKKPLPSDRGADKGFVGHQASKQMKRALGIEQRMNNELEKKEDLLKNKEKERVVVIETEKGANRPLVILNNVRVDIEGRTILDDVALSLEQGERLAITGPNGCGKSTLLDVIAGDTEPNVGVCVKSPKLSISRGYQRPLWQQGSLRELIEGVGIDETRYRQILGTVGVSGDIFDRPLETYSKGQLKKVDLCRSLVDPAAVLVWDEPMNYIDVFSREQIEAAILAFRPTMIFVEHDQYFIDRVATRVMTLP